MKELEKLFQRIDQCVLSSFSEGWKDWGDPISFEASNAAKELLKNLDTEFFPDRINPSVDGSIVFEDNFYYFVAEIWNIEEVVVLLRDGVCIDGSIKDIVQKLKHEKGN